MKADGHKIQSIVLDFDGTIADTRQSIIKTISLVMKKMELELPKDVHIQDYIGLPIKETLIHVCNIQKDKIQDAIILYRSFYDDVALNEVSLFPGVYSTLKLLHKSLSISIASSKGKNSLERLIRKLDIYDFIDIILGEQDVENKKPAPDMVLKIASLRNFKPEEMIVVGDTIYDIEMGKSAKAYTCAVTYGNHSFEKLISAKPDYILNDFGDLLRIVYA